MTVLDRNWRCRPDRRDRHRGQGRRRARRLRGQDPPGGRTGGGLPAPDGGRHAGQGGAAARPRRALGPGTRGSATRRGPHRPGRRPAAASAVRPWWNTHGGWRDGIRPYVFGGAGRCRGRGRRGPGGSRTRRRRVHAGGAARQEPDGEPGPGPGRGRQLGRGLAAEEAHGGAQPGVRAQERQRVRPRRRGGRARCRRADRSPGPRRHRDDRRAGPRRPGATGPGHPAGGAGGGRRGIRAGRRAGVRGGRGRAGPRACRCWACAVCGS